MNLSEGEAARDRDLHDLEHARCDGPLVDLVAGALWVALHGEELLGYKGVDALQADRGGRGGGEGLTASHKSTRAPDVVWRG